MAPVTRRSQSNAKPVARKQSHAREESWEFLESKRNGHSNPGQESPLLLNPPRYADALHPLQAMAERVGTQVEEFAQKVDQWHGQVQKDASTRHHATINLAKALGNIARNTVTSLKKKHGRKDNEDLHKRMKRRIERFNEGTSLTSSVRGEDRRVNLRSDTRESTLQDLRHWQSEANTWDLLQLLLPFDYQEPGSDFEQTKKDYLARRGQPYRYTPESQIWERFLLENDTARERQVVLKWLETTAENTESDLKAMVQQLEAGAGHGKGTWSQGWLDTRLAVKQHKRLRAWGTIVGDEATIYGSNGELIVNQLDPDAATRQNRGLAEADDYYERSLWLTSWEMLRRGKPWQEVREWFAERREGWRVISLGMAHATQDARTCLAGPHAGALWRRMCFATARHEHFNSENERAVYGLLSGDIQTVDPVCRTWDDFLHARYNSLLLGQFDKHLQENFPDRIPPTLANKFKIFEPSESQIDPAKAGQLVVNSLKTLKQVEAEAKQPIKLIQGSLIAKTAKDLIHNLGVALSKKANADGAKSKLIPPTDLEVDESILSMADDPDALRVIAHVYLIYKALGMDIGEGIQRWMFENVLVSYIDFLRMAGKIDHIPVYAAQLSETRADIVLGRVLMDVINVNEQKTLVRLMSSYHLNLVTALTEQYLFATSESSLLPEDGSSIDQFAILETTDDPLWPRQRVRKDFVPEEVTQEEETIIRSVEWFMHVRGRWNVTFTALIYVMKRFLLSGRFNAALELTKRIPYKMVSYQKTPDVLSGRAVDVMDGNALDEAESVPELRRSTRSGSRRPSATAQPAAPVSEQKLRLDLLREQSKPYYEMQQLVHALEALSKWRRVEDEAQIATVPTRTTLSPEHRAPMRKAFDEVCDAVEPLLHDFLTHGSDATDLADYTAIRTAYLPALLLAYNTVLHVAAHVLSRDHMLKAMDLATIVASEDDTALAECVARAGRMSELVAAFALDSRALLGLNEVRAREEAGAGPRRGRDRRKMRGWVGETVEVWDLGKVN